MIHYQPADIVLVRGTGFVSRAIRFLTRGIGESRTKISHVGIITTNGPDPLIVESLRVTRRARFLACYTGSVVAVYRPIKLADKTKYRIARAADDFLGKPYGYLKLVAHTLDWMLLGAYVFRRLARFDNYPICSYLVAQAFNSEGLTFGVEPGAASPDDIWDYVTTHPEVYRCVRQLGEMR